MAAKTRQDTEAAQRWRILRQALRSRSVELGAGSFASVRRFASFGLFRVEPHGEEEEEEEEKEAEVEWLRFSCPQMMRSHALIRRSVGAVNLNDILNSFDNTGNVCVWPAEEVMAFYCIQHRHMFRGLSVCELGGGMTCLAGLMVSITAEAKEVLLTDGNDKAIKNVNMILERNTSAGLITTTDVTSRVLRWDNDEDISPLEGKFNILLCADCLFVDEYRASLVNTLHRLLRPRGTALVFAPQRGNTLDKFCVLAERSRFRIEKQESYDERVSAIHSTMKAEGKNAYDDNLHYPILLTLTRSA